MDSVCAAAVLLLVCTAGALVTHAAGVSAKEPSPGSRVRPDFCSTTYIELDKPCTDELCNAECMKLFPGPGGCEKGKCLCGFC
ncbi:hypothetical protein VPH35_058880 [Triticum aestivum]|uniref:Uncharacterized protein n=2 Tax=Aegilops tauschii TaxID=37682 RepID=A0A453EDA7_AEGTS